MNYLQRVSSGAPAPVAAPSTTVFAARPGSPGPGPLMGASNDSVCWICHAEVRGLPGCGWLACQSRGDAALPVMHELSGAHASTLAAARSSQQASGAQW